MSLRFLLDTNVLSEPMKLRPDEWVMENLRVHSPEAAIAAPVWHELLYGRELLRASRRRRLIEEFLLESVRPNFEILPYESRAAAWHARERARLERKGRPPPFVDGQIAAVAVVNGLTLVTANVRDFRGFRDLDVVDWSKA